VYLLNWVRRQNHVYSREASMRPAALLSGSFLLLVALGHLLRLVLQVELAVDGIVLPMWPSVIAVVGPTALAVWLWRDQQRLERGS
jgi:hypothetical protein